MLCRELARLSGGKRWSLEYRFGAGASRHRWPAMMPGMRWLDVAAHADTLGADNRARLAGATVGRHAATVTILARDAGVPLALQLVVHPVAPHHQDTIACDTYARGLVQRTGHPLVLAATSPRTPSAGTGASPAACGIDVDGVGTGSGGLAAMRWDEGIGYADKLCGGRGGWALRKIYRGVTHGIVKMGQRHSRSAPGPCRRSSSAVPGFLREVEADAAQGIPLVSHARPARTRWAGGYAEDSSSTPTHLMYIDTAMMTDYWRALVSVPCVGLRGGAGVADVRKGMAGGNTTHRRPWMTRWMSACVAPRVGNCV